MGLDDLVRSAITLAASLTQPFQASVTHYATTGNDAYGRPVLNPVGVERRAIVVDSDVNTPMRNQLGIEIVAHTKVIFLGQVAVDLSDRIDLPGGRTSPILRVEHAVRPASGADFVTIVYME